MISTWLWIGIFVFLYLIFTHRKEIKKAELDSVHLCMIFFICCLAGVPIFLMYILENLKEDDEEENEEEKSERKIELLEELKEQINILIKFFRK